MKWKSKGLKIAKTILEEKKENLRFERGKVSLSSYFPWKLSQATREGVEKNPGNENSVFGEIRRCLQPQTRKQVEKQSLKGLESFPYDLLLGNKSFCFLMLLLYQQSKVWSWLP